LIRTPQSDGGAKRLYFEVLLVDHDIYVLCSRSWRKRYGYRDCWKVLSPFIRECCDVLCVIGCGMFGCSDGFKVQGCRARGCG
jgi:hypothetical protein